MIYIVTPDLYSEYACELRKMHRLRYRVFKERLGWDVTGENCEERDAFDDLDPIYILALNDSEAVVGSWRLLPTTGPNMLRDVFAELLEGHPAPSDPLVWECSRFSVDCSNAQSDCLAAVSHVSQEIVCGLLEYCLAKGIREVVSVYDVRIARMFPRIGAGASWQSRPQRIGKTLSVFGRFSVNQTMLDGVRLAGGIGGSVIRNKSCLLLPHAA